MKRLFLLFAFMVVSFAPILSVQAKNDTTYQKKADDVKTPKIGFYLYVQKCGEVYELKTESIEQVYFFVNFYHPDFCANIEHMLTESPYYRENCYKREIYIEKMMINKRGKYKRIKHFTK